MQILYREEWKATGAPLIGNNGKFRPLIEPWDTGYNGRGSQLLGRPRRKEPFGRALLTLLGITFVSLATVYLLLECFRHLSLRYGAGPAYRGLAEGHSQKGAACQGDSEEGEEDTGNAGEYGGPTGNQEAPRDEQTRASPQRGQQQGALPAHPSAASGGASVVSDNGGSTGARPKTKIRGAEPPEQPGIEAGWGFRAMPERTCSYLQYCLSLMTTTAENCRSILPWLSAQDGARLVMLLTALAAVELSAFSVGPLEQEPARQAVAQAYISLVEDSVQGLQNLQGTDLQQLRQKLEALGRVVQELQKPRPMDKVMGVKGYRTRMLGQLKLFHTASVHVREILRRLSLLSIQTLSRTEVLQELSVLTAVVYARTSQLLRERSMRWWLGVCQGRAGTWVVFAQDELQTGHRRRPFTSIEEAVNEIDESAASARVWVAPQPFPVGYWQGEPAAGETWAPQMGEGTWPHAEAPGGDDVWETGTASGLGQGTPHDAGLTHDAGQVSYGLLGMAPAPGPHLPGMSHEPATGSQGHEDHGASGEALQLEGAVGGISDDSSTGSRQGGMQPEDVRTSVFASLSDLRSAVNTVRHVLPTLDATSGLTLVKLVTSLATMELSAFSSFPRMFESRRQEVASQYIKLVRGILNEVRGPNTAIRRNLEGMESLLKYVRKSTPVAPNVKTHRFRAWMSAHTTACHVSSHHLLAILQSMMLDDSPRPDAAEFIQQQLKYLETLVKLRTRQIVTTPMSHYWLAKAQAKAQYWVLSLDEQLRAAAIAKSSGDLMSLVRDMDKALAPATGTAVLPPHVDPPLHQQVEVQVTPVTPQSPAGVVHPFVLPQEMVPFSAQAVPQRLEPVDPDSTQSQPHPYGLPFGSRMPSPGQRPFASPYATPEWPPAPFSPLLPSQYPHGASRPSAPLDQGSQTTQSADGFDHPPHSGHHMDTHELRQVQPAADGDATDPKGHTGRSPSDKDEEDDEGSLDPVLLQLFEKGLSWEDVPETDATDPKGHTGRSPSDKDEEDDEGSLDPVLLQLFKKGLSWEDVPETDEDGTARK